jgi:Spy/CpxP family protein refolding chaperone
MKIHKISLIAALAAAVLGLSPALRAQEQDAKKERPPAAPVQRGDAKERLNRMAEELKLTEAQKPKVEAVLKEQAEKMRALREATPQERRDKAQAMRADMDKKMKEILDAEQYAKWQKGREQSRGPREGRPDGPRGEKKSKEKKAEQN